jgi:hypothetical protein
MASFAEAVATLSVWKVLLKLAFSAAKYTAARYS